MPESRDRLLRSNNRVAETYVPRQMTTGILSILADNDVSIQTPFRWGATPLNGEGFGQRIGEGFGQRTGEAAGRGLFATPMTATRRGGRNQNTPPSGTTFRRGRGRPGVLPAWYPRTPLRDITSIVRAVERRRARLGDGEGSVLGSPIPTMLVNQPASQVPSALGARLESEVSFVTPKPKLGYKAFRPSPLGKIPIITEIVNQGGEVSTPQKKLLDSIELVEKVVMEELNRLKRTPAAKKAEREKKVRTLMSMR